MKIIHLVLGKANPNRMNGVNKVVNSLATYQTQLGQDVSLWGITSTPEAPVPTRNYATRLFPALKHKFWLHSSISDAIQQISEPTTFHLHGGFIPEFYHLSKLLHKHHIPYVHTAHGAYNTIAMQRSKWLKKIYFNCFERSVLRHAQSLHFIGESELKAIHSLITHPNCQLIPNGQEFGNQHLSQKKRAKAPIFGFCGRLDIHTKGLDVLFKAFALYSKTSPLTELWIIGDSDQKATLEQLAVDLGIRDQVLFWGKKFGSKKDQLFQQMDVFFHPSRNEGLPGAVLEAAAMGLPCVVSKESNMGNYMEVFQAGQQLAKNDAEHLSQAMHGVHQVWENESAYRQMQNQALYMIETAFDWKQIAAQHLANYHLSFRSTAQTA